MLPLLRLPARRREDRSKHRYDTQTTRRTEGIATALPRCNSACGLIVAPLRLLVSGVQAVVRPPGTITAGGTGDADVFGDLVRVQSAFEDGRKWTDVGELDESLVGQRVWVRARLAKVRGTGRNAFLVLRKGFSTVQAVAEENANFPKEGVKYATKIPSESVVDVFGEVVKPAEDIKSTSQSKVELKVIKVFGVSIGATALPFQLDDAARPESEVAAAVAAPAAAASASASSSESKDDKDKKEKVKAAITVGQDLRLNNRWLDVRTPANHAIFRLQSRVCQYYRNYFLDQDFVEIHTPKLTPGVSEGGASVFRLKYLGGVNACLAQSPQLYKQMAVTSDLTKVFEIGPVFRAEDSNTHRSAEQHTTDEGGREEEEGGSVARLMLTCLPLCFFLLDTCASSSAWISRWRSSSTITRCWPCSETASSPSSTKSTRTARRSSPRSTRSTHSSRSSTDRWDRRSSSRSPMRSRCCRRMESRSESSMTSRTKHNAHNTHACLVVCIFFLFSCSPLLFLLFFPLTICV